MESKIHKQLEEAKAHFYAWRMPEAYNILRRFFDRLPFQVDRAHAEYISMFVRVLGELGKSSSLKFYVSELERIYESKHEAVIAYTLAVVYLSLAEPRPESAKNLLESIIRDPTAAEFHVKAKIALANYYDRFTDNILACRMIIDSIGEVSDPALGKLVKVWQGKQLRDEQKYAEAEQLLTAVISDIDPKDDWYAYFSAKVVLGILYLRQKRIDEASRLVRDLRKRFEGRSFKTVQIHLATLAQQIEREERLGVIQFLPGETASTFIYSNNPLTLKKRTAPERLLVLLLKRKFLDKSAIIKLLYKRDYDALQDDKLVYYHIHSLRKRIQGIGLPAEAIKSEGNGYRWIPEVETIGEQSWV